MTPPSTPLPSTQDRGSAPATAYDVVVIGGAFSGASFATLLARRLPSAKILIVERSERFERKVGEATVEVSGAFLHRELGLYDHLSREHLPKHGLRYWMHADAGDSLGAMTEIGPSNLPDLPSFQLDRPILDRHLLGLAREAGVTVRRPAKVVSVDLGWPRSRVVLEGVCGVSDDDSAAASPDGGLSARQETVEARWVIDASGRQALLARRLKLHQPIDDEQKTAALWARWRGVADIDRIEVEHADGRRAPLPRVAASRRLATNHFCGYGWWCWVIPLARGGTSIGLVYDKTLFEPPGDDPLRQRYERFVRTMPGLRELTAEASIETLGGTDGAGDESGVDDFMALSRLPYTTRRYADRGWALVGDAASFIDPFYSPGLDHASMSIAATVDLVARELDGALAGRALDAALRVHDETFRRSVLRWREAIYHGKYELLGDADLTHCAFLIDTALYYLGVVTPVYADGAAMKNPPFGVALPQATVAYRVARAVSRRLLGLARFRRRAGLYGRSNRGQRRYSPAFRGGTGAVRPLLAGLRMMLRLELERLLYRLRSGTDRDVVPGTTPAADTLPG